MLPVHEPEMQGLLRRQRLQLPQQQEWEVPVVLVPPAHKQRHCLRILVLVVAAPLVVVLEVAVHSSNLRLWLQLKLSWRTLLGTAALRGLNRQTFKT